MEEIVKEVEIAQVKLSRIKDDDFIGIDWGDCKIKVVSKNGVYFGIGVKDTNFDSKWGKDSMKEYVEACFRQLKSKAYRFDSEEELLEWLLEK